MAKCSHKLLTMNTMQLIYESAIDRPCCNSSKNIMMQYVITTANFTFSNYFLPKLKNINKTCYKYTLSQLWKHTFIFHNHTKILKYESLWSTELIQIHATISYNRLKNTPTMPKHPNEGNSIKFLEQPEWIKLKLSWWVRFIHSDCSTDLMELPSFAC